MKLLEEISSYEMILVGIGEEFEEKFLDLNIRKDQNSLLDDWKRREYLETHKETALDLAYKKLETLLENKNYFIVTLSQDDKIYNSGLEKKRIVAPCGTFSRLQCIDVCTSDIYPLEDYMEKISNKEIVLCPSCGKELVMNRIGVGKYSEEGYLRQWENYTKWLQGTLNKKLLILELGVGLKFPSVIRWPFEKMCYLNEKSKMIRVHDFLYQITEEIKEKGTGWKQDPVDFLLNQIV